MDTGCEIIDLKIRYFSIHFFQLLILIKLFIHILKNSEKSFKNEAYKLNDEFIKTTTYHKNLIYLLLGIFLI